MSQSAGRATDHPTRAWLVAALAVAAWYLPFTAHVGFTGFVSDDALYLLMADALSGSTSDARLLAYVRHMSHFPPLYPLVLALAGGGSAQLDIAHLVQGLLVVVALAAHGWFARQALVSARGGLLALLAVAVLPATLLFASELWSEFLYLALAGAALAAASIARGQPRWWLLAATLAGLALVTRSIGVCLVLAILVALARRERRYVIPCALLGALPYAAARWLHLGSGGDYLRNFAARIGDLVSLRQTVAANLDAWQAAWPEIFGVAPGAAATTAIAILLGLAALGACWRLASDEADGYYVPAYLLLLLVWPFPDVATRLLYPVVPILMVHAALGAASLASMLPRGHYEHAAVATLGAVLLLAAAGTAPLLARYLGPAPSGELAAYRATRYWLTAADRERGETDLAVKHAMVRLMRETGQHVATDECIHARHPAAVMFHARRIAWPPPPTSDRPACRYHLLLADDSLAAQYATLWPGYDVVVAMPVAGGTAGVLVRYRR